MFNTFAATVTGYDAAEAHALAMDEFVPGWEVREDFGIRFLSERDFAPDVEVDGPSDEDWSAFLEMSWVDPAERMLG